MLENNNTPEIRFKGYTNAWEQRTLGDYVTIISGDAPSKFEEGNELYVKVDDLNYNSKYVIDSQNKVALHNSIKKAPKGSVVFPKRGAAIMTNKVRILAEDSYMDTNMMALSSDKIDSEFLYNVISKEGLYKIADTSTIPQINNKHIEPYEVLLPGLDEQIRIGKFFEDVDNLITLHQRKYDKLVKIKKSMLEKMFPQKGSKFPEIRFKRYTDAWEQRKFSSVFDGLQNNTLSRSDLNYESGSVKNVHYGDVLIKFGDYIDASETELPYISDDTKVEKFKNSFLYDGDIIIADTAEDDTVGKCTEIRGSEGLKLLSGLHTIACRPKDNYGPMFLGYYLNSPAYHNQLKPLMQGIKVTSISKSALQDTDMLIPKSIEEQTRIGEYFAGIDNLITLHQRKLGKLRNIKKSMLEKMFV